MAVLLGLADVVLIPTFAYEGACLAAIEATCAGVPVLASDVGGLNDTVIDGWNGLLAKALPSDIGSRLAELLANEGLRVRLGGEGRRFADLYSIEAWVLRMESVLFSVLGDISVP